MTARTNLVVVRPLIDYSRVRISDVGHIGRFVHDGDVAFGRYDGAPDLLCTEVASAHESVLIGADLVIVVGPIMDAAATIEARFGRQGRPADIVVACSPGNPGRRPFFTGNPDPADATQPRPTPVMIGGPAKWLVRDPGPASVRINPASFGVRPPTTRFLGFARLPDETVLGRFAPRAVRLEFAIKGAVRSGRARFRSFAGPTCCCRRSLRGFRGLFRGDGRGGGTFLIRERFLASFQLCLLLGEALLFLRLPFGREALLHLALDLCFLFLFGLRLVAGNTKGESSDENTKLFHGEI